MKRILLMIALTAPLAAQTSTLKYPSPRKLNPEIPRELERILAKSMQKRKEDRFKSTQDLVLALERFISKRVEMNYHARLVLFLRIMAMAAAWRSIRTS